MKPLLPASLILLLAALGCAKVSPIAPAPQAMQSPEAGTTLASRSAIPLPGDHAGTVTYRYIVGTEFFAEIEGCRVIDVTRAAVNRDVIEIAGEGTFVAGPGGGSATGGGTFVHRRANGDVVGNGTWTATRLVGFHSYGDGTPQGLPPEFEGGLALLQVHLSPGLDGLLAIDCLLGRTPAGHKEGVSLAVNGAINFNQKQSGCTLFIRQSS